MKLINLLGSGLASSALALICTIALAAAPTYKEAVSDFNSGKYKEALTKFSTLMKANNTNATLHYYSAMCHQNLGHIGEARAEYQFVATNGDAALQGYAQKALASLGKQGTTTHGTAANTSTAGINGMGVLSVVSPNVSGMKPAPPPK